MTWPQFFAAGQCFRHMEWKHRKTHWHEAVSSALKFTFLKEVSQNCFVFDAVNLKMKTLRRISSFLTLSSSKIEEVSQYCCVFDVAKFKNWVSLAEQLRFQTCR